MEFGEGDAERRHGVMRVARIRGELLPRGLRAEVERAVVGGEAGEEGEAGGARLAGLGEEAQLGIVEIAGQFRAVLTVQFLVVREERGEVGAADELEVAARVRRGRHDEEFGGSVRNRRESLELEAADGHVLLHGEDLLHVFLLAFDAALQNHAVPRAQKDRLAITPCSKKQTPVLDSVPSARFHATDSMW